MTLLKNLFHTTKFFINVVFGTHVKIKRKILPDVFNVARKFICVANDNNLGFAVCNTVSIIMVKNVRSLRG